MDPHESSEDILSESLSFIGAETPVDTENISYGPLQLSVAKKVGVFTEYHGKA
jgi:hypothetical protein